MTTREQLIAWARKEFGVSNGTQTWIEFQGSAESLADAILAANVIPAPAQVVTAEHGEAARYHALRLTLMADHMQGADYKRNMPDIIKLRNAVTFLDTLHAAGMTVTTEGVE
jgi:hypothetical protein